MADLRVIPMPHQEPEACADDVLEAAKGKYSEVVVIGIPHDGGLLEDSDNVLDPLRVFFFLHQVADAIKERENGE